MAKAAVRAEHSHRRDELRHEPTIAAVAVGTGRQCARERLLSVVTAVPECVTALVEVGAQLADRDPGLAGERSGMGIEPANPVQSLDRNHRTTRVEAVIVGMPLPDDAHLATAVRGTAHERG